MGGNSETKADWDSYTDFLNLFTFNFELIVLQFHHGLIMELVEFFVFSPRGYLKMIICRFLQHFSLYCGPLHCRVPAPVNPQNLQLELRQQGRPRPLALPPAVLRALARPHRGSTLSRHTRDRNLRLSRLERFLLLLVRGGSSALLRGSAASRHRNLYPTGYYFAP